MASQQEMAQGQKAQDVGPTKAITMQAYRMNLSPTLSLTPTLSLPYRTLSASPRLAREHVARGLGPKRKRNSNMMGFWETLPTST